MYVSFEKNLQLASNEWSTHTSGLAYKAEGY
jgi:hypothetical protein